MMIRRHILISTLLLCSCAPLWAQEEEVAEESSDLMELQVIASPREDGAMRKQPTSVSIASYQQLQDIHATSLKGLNTLMPNFFMPDYGSRQSSAVYIRGIGSRINSPAVGLYIDDVPVLDKSAFDFSLNDIQRVDVLRGPQTTLYGSGTMGGVIRAYSRSPFTYQGTDISLGFATRDNTRSFGLMHYSKPLDRFAWAFGGFYNGGDGFFHNDFKENKPKMDFYSGGGVSFRAVLETLHRWTLDMNMRFEVDNEGAYPYYYVGRQNGEEDKPEQLYRINNNITGLYDRTVFRTSLNASRNFPRLEFKSITALQSLKDTMQMDQDFLSDDIYKLTQRQKNVTLSEDLLLKSRKPGKWQWISGFTTSLMNSKIKAPVTFRQEGIAWLNQTINNNANKHMPIVENGATRMQFEFDDQILGKELIIKDKFNTQNLSAGIFHQSTFSSLFGMEGLSATLGLRLNVETRSLKYASWYDFDHLYNLTGYLTQPVERVINMVTDQESSISNGLYSSNYDSSTKGIIADSPIRNTDIDVMPRIALQYQMGQTGNIYASVSRGYRSGGYNVQNISELMRSLMMRDMMQDVRDLTLEAFEGMTSAPGGQAPMIPAESKDKIINGIGGMANIPTPDVVQACTYDPEYAWNYEIGTHLNFWQGRMALDASAFLSDISDLQLSQMSETGLGRIMVNAGKSRSVGMEMMMKVQPVSNLLLQANYGYTHATFRDYSDYDANTNSLVECEGNYVPFMPQHTVNFDIAYTFLLNQNRPAYTFRRNGFIAKGLTVGANYAGAGRIYWTEQNDAWQDYYSTIGARISLDMHPLTLTLWGSNLTNSNHNTFWFVSAGRAYEQHARPLQVGLDAKFSF